MNGFIQWGIFVGGSALILGLSFLISKGYRLFNCEAPNIGASCSFLAGTGVYFLFTGLFLPDVFSIWPTGCVLATIALLCPFTAPKEWRSRQQSEERLWKEEKNEDFFF